EVAGPPAGLVAGQEGQAPAPAYPSDGTAMDVTWLATWVSTQASVASIDGWGRISALTPGSTDITAALGDVVSAPLSIEVVERPTLLRINVQNASCYYPAATREDSGVVRP